MFKYEDKAIRNTKTSALVKHLTKEGVMVELLATKRCALFLEILCTWTNDVKQCNINTVLWERQQFLKDNK